MFCCTHQTLSYKARAQRTRLLACFALCNLTESTLLIHFLANAENIWLCAANIPGMHRLCWLTGPSLRCNLNVWPGVAGSRTAFERKDKPQTLLRPVILKTRPPPGLEQRVCSQPTESFQSTNREGSFNQPRNMSPPTEIFRSTKKDDSSTKPYCGLQKSCRPEHPTPYTLHPHCEEEVVPAPPADCFQSVIYIYICIYIYIYTYRKQAARPSHSRAREHQGPKYARRSPGSAWRLRRGGRRPFQNEADRCCHGEAELSRNTWVVESLKLTGRQLWTRRKRLSARNGPKFATLSVRSSLRPYGVAYRRIYE